MKSSSKLFPVQLISADQFGLFTEDTYLLNPGNSSDASVRLAITRLRLKQTASLSNSDNVEFQNKPLILLHPLFHNRSYWYSRDGHGLGAVLANKGFDIWLPELRGHGQSPVNKDYLSNSVNDFIINDLPAFHKFVCEQTKLKASWLAVDFSAQLLLSAIGIKSIPDQTLQAAVIIDQHFTQWHSRLMQAPSTLKKRLKWQRNKIVSGIEYCFGAENESWSILQRAITWSYLGKKWRGKSGCYWDNLENISHPTLVIGRKTRPQFESIFNNLRLKVKNMLSENKLVNLEIESAAMEDKYLYDEPFSEALVKNTLPVICNWILAHDLCESQTIANH